MATHFQALMATQYGQVNCENMILINIRKRGEKLQEEDKNNYRKLE